MSTGPTRRAVLGLPAVVLLASCTDTAPPEPEPVDPDDALRDAAAARERALLEAYDAAVAAQPSLTARLAPLRAHHVEHLAALLGPAPSAAASAPAPGGRPGATTPAAALAALAQAERAAGAAHAQDCLAASRELAGVLASLSASELSHPVALA